MLKKKARASVMWSGFDALIRQGVGFIISILLARLLVPEDFGVIALLALFLGLANVFVSAGFSLALIQRKDLTHSDESTVFWFNIAAALVVTLLLFAISPWIADFFVLPILIPLTMLMACNILINAMGSVHGALLTKNLKFKKLMKIGVASTLISGSVGVYMAWADYGVWALAVQSMTGTVISTALLWFFSPWRPLPIFSRNSFMKLFSFSGWIFASMILDTIYQRGYNLLIGKYYGVYDLGIYNRADNIQQLPSGVMTTVLSRVAFPLFSQVNDDKERLCRGARMSVRSIMLITSPIMFGLAVLSEPFIREVFGEQWLPAVPILQVLCVSGLLFPLHVINLNVLQAQGHGRLFFRLEIIKKSFGITLLVIGSFFGVMGIAWSRIIQSAIGLIINSHYTRKHLGYGLLIQIRDCMSSIILSAVMATVVIFFDNAIEMDGVVELLMLIAIGASFYLASNILLGIETFKEAIYFIKGENQDEKSN